MARTGAKLTSEERETIINYTDAEKTANVYTTSQVCIRRFEKLAKANKLPIERTEESLCINVPKNWIVVRKPRELSRESRERVAIQLKQSRLAKSCNQQKIGA